MSMIIYNNMQAKNTLNQLNKNNKALGKSLEKVSSGMRINNAGDDASGYAISERMRVQVRALDQDDRNTQNGSSMLRVAEGAVQSDIEILRTLKEKVINAANDTNTDEDRKIIQREFDQMIDQIDDNANVTYNGMKLMDGSRNHLVVAPGTKTCLTNIGLHPSTEPYMPVTEFCDRTGNNIGILPSDNITISYVKQGKTFVKTFPVIRQDGSDQPHNLATMLTELGTANISMQLPFSPQIGLDAYGNKVYTPDFSTALTFRAVEPGVDGQISGLTFCITDRYGDPRGSANTVLDNFTETIRAENPSPDNSIILQTGTKSNQAVKLGLSDMRTTALGLRAKDGSTLNISTQKAANAAINVLETALLKATNQATTIGAAASRLGMTSANITVQAENTQASESVIRDADMAKEMTDYTKNNVLQQASQSMLAQANQNSSSVLSLLQ